MTQDKTLKEEFYEFANPTREGYEQPEDLHLFYPRKYNKEIADWWLEKFSSHNTELIRKIEKLADRSITLSMNERGFGYRDALDEVISIIKQQI